MSSEVKPFPVEKEYEKNPDISPEDILKLREWLETQPHLPVEHITDLDLIMTYHACERSAEVAKQVLDLNFTLRTLFTSFFTERLFTKRTELTLKTVVIANLPMPTVRGYRANYVSLMDPDHRNFNFTDTIKTHGLLIDLWQYEEGTWPGFEIIINFDKSSVSHLAKAELMPLRQLLYYLQEAMFVKLKGIHFMNAPSFMDKIMMMMRPFLKKELLDMMWIHQRDSATLFEYIPKASLPKDCGGEYKDFKTISDETIAYLKNNINFFEEERKRRVNEELRKGKKKTVEDIFGIAGSFKKLDID